MRKAFTIIVVLFLMSCGKNICPESSRENQQLYKSYMRLISDYETGKKKVFVDDYREATNFLSFTTGIISESDYSSTFGYKKKEQFENDMKLWRMWYKKNKCMLTKYYVDSVMKHYNYERKH